MRFNFPYTARQREMVEHPARILWLGCGTKTGKSAGLYCWLIDGLLAGEACAFVGPWFFRSRAAFDSVKGLLQPLIAARVVRVNEARLQITSNNGGYLDFTSADNANALFGGNYHRCVVDEASRCPEQIYAAALTVISGTNGRLRLAFNLELGSKNWAIRNLLRVQALSPEERIATGEDFLTFPTGGDGLVAPELIEILRSQMPETLWRALYLAEIPTSDTSLFRNLDRVFTGRERETPEEGHTYIAAVDVARKQDWTIVTIIDDTGAVVMTDRFNQISWSLQVERCALWYRTFRCSKAIVDSTGVGDAIAEQFEGMGMVVEPYVFTVPTRKALVEELVIACDNADIKIPPTEKFRVYRQELESMEYTLDGTTARYAVPSSMHDDALFSLALAVHAWRASRGAILGVIELLKRSERAIKAGVDWLFSNKAKNVPATLSSEPAPGPAAAVETRVDGFQIWQQTHRAPPCPNCKSDLTTYMSNGFCGVQLFCKSCGAVDGVVARHEKIAGVNCCDSPLKQVIPNGVKCGNCGHVTTGAVPIGLAFKDLGPGGRGGRRL